jgi:TolA-binding protein
MTESHRLADYVQPKLSEARIARQWAQIREREPKRMDSAFRYVYMAAALLVVLGLVFVLGRQFSGSEVAENGFVVEHGMAGEQRLVLPEGIVVEVAKASDLRVRSRSATETVLGLERGQAVFDVTHRDGRRVVVATPAFDVEVVGTRFRVQVADQEEGTTPDKVPEVSIEVLRGTVRVQPKGGTQKKGEVRTITTGQRWSSLPREAKTVVVAQTPTETVSSAEAPSTLPTQNPERTAAPLSAKELFELAERHRVGGRLAAAASALDALRRNYPSDSRAALAAFELGRIRMDGLGELSGAVVAFNSAIKLNPAGAYREDAEARLVQLHERLGQLDVCRQTKTRYLKSYPQGRHVNAVRSACDH